MKIYSLIAISMAILLSGCAASSSQSGKERKTAKNEKRIEEFAKTSALIESGNYVYQVQSVNPTGGSTIQTTSMYTMKATDGTFEADLPFFGRAYQADYGGNGGIKFNGEPENLEIRKDARKYTISVSFSIKQPDDQFQVNLSIGSNGYGTLNITSQKRQPISYYGFISEVTE